MPVLENEKHERFCQLVANGEKPYKAYEMAGYSAKSRQTAYRLLKKSYIAERIAELKPAMEERRAQAIDTVIETNLRDSVGRVEALCGRWKKLQEVIRARAEYGDSRTVPGGNTGYVVTGWKVVGGTRMQTHEVDIALLKELREIEKQIAIELGQWVDKSDSTIRRIEDVPDAVLDQMIVEGRRLRAERERKEAEAKKKESVQ